MVELIAGQGVRRYGIRGVVRRIQGTSAEVEWSQPPGKDALQRWIERPWHDIELIPTRS